MNATTRQHIEHIAHQSNLGQLSFPENVGALIKLDVETYFADYRKMETTYYTKKDEAYPVTMPNMDVAITDAFNPAELQAAIRAAQRDEIRYPEFKKRSMAAGCIGYFVWITGRHVTYFGRRGETHIEKFPD